MVTVHLLKGRAFAMFNGIYSSASAMEIESLRHEIVANNLANVNSPGFRRTLLAISSREGNLATGLRGGKPAETHVDFTQGPIMDTSRTLDVAISGDGFFVVETPDGPRYTRNGSFHMNSESQLVTGQGYPVTGGGPISIPGDVAISTVTIGPDGTVRGNGSELGKLDIVKFADNSVLKPTKSSMFEAPENAATEPSDAVLMQGSLEGSNASIVHEMVAMIIGMRHFEAAQQSLKSISDVVQQYTTMEQ